MEKQNRRSVRVQGFDYSTPGAYFLTICTNDLLHLFGHIEGSQMQLSAEGQIAQTAWASIPAHFPHVEADEFVIMPNHVHGILFISERPDRNSIDRALGKVTKGSIPVIVRSFKSAVTREVGLLRGRKEPVWQRNYYEHVIRNEESLYTLQEYILENPLKWELDELNIRR